MSNDNKQSELIPINQMPDLKNRLEEYISNLNQKPTGTKQRTDIGNKPITYLPIGEIEDLLDYYYNGLWKTTNEQTRIVANEILVSIELHVLHPEAGIWLTRIGSAGRQIRFKNPGKDEQGNKKAQDITNINNKLQNACMADYPSAKAAAISNAAASLGKVFGRSLNRETLNQLSTGENGRTIYDEIEDARAQMKDTTTQEELGKIWKSLPETARRDRNIKDEFAKKKWELNDKK